MRGPVRTVGPVFYVRRARLIFLYKFLQLLCVAFDYVILLGCHPEHLMTFDPWCDPHANDETKWELESVLYYNTCSILQHHPEHVMTFDPWCDPHANDETKWELERVLYYNICSILQYHPEPLMTFDPWSDPQANDEMRTELQSVLYYNTCSILEHLSHSNCSITWTPLLIETSWART